MSIYPKQSTRRLGNNQTVIEETLDEPTIDTMEILHIMEYPSLWKLLLVKYLEEGSLPKTPKEIVTIKKSTTFYMIINDQLHKRGYLVQLLKCVAKEQSEYVTI